MLIGRTDDPRNPCRVAAFEVTCPFGCGSRYPSGPAVEWPHKKGRTHERYRTRSDFSRLPPCIQRAVHTRRAWIAEFAVAGGAAGISAALLGTLAAFITVQQVFHLDWHFQLGIMLATLLGSIALMLVLGFMTTSRILRLPAAPQLRLESGM